MPAFDGRGPGGAGPMTGRGFGFCGGPDALNAPMVRGARRAPGYGRGNRCGNGLGRGAGWFSVGYGSSAPIGDFHASLEQKRAFLEMELKRTEALLKMDDRNENPLSGEKIEK